MRKDRVAAVTNTGSPSDFFQRSQFLGANFEGRGLVERDWGSDELQPAIFHCAVIIIFDSN